MSHESLELCLKGLNSLCQLHGIARDKLKHTSSAHKFETVEALDLRYL